MRNNILTVTAAILVNPIITVHTKASMLRSTKGTTDFAGWYSALNAVIRRTLLTDSVRVTSLKWEGASITTIKPNKNTIVLRLEGTKTLKEKDEVYSIISRYLISNPLVTWCATGSETKGSVNTATDWEEDSFEGKTFALITQAILVF